MIVTGSPKREVDFDSFADLTPTAVASIGWGPDGVLQVEFASDLTVLEVAAVQRRIASRNANEEELRRLAEVALVNNRDFLAIASPTQVQTLAQVKALTRQNNGVIRMLLGFLDGTD